MGIAVFWILNGLAKKLILSDYLAVNHCDRVFENPLLYSGFENLLALSATPFRSMPTFQATLTSQSVWRC